MLYAQDGLYVTIDRHRREPANLLDRLIAELTAHFGADFFTVKERGVRPLTRRQYVVLQFERVSYATAVWAWVDEHFEPNE